MLPHYGCSWSWPTHPRVLPAVLLVDLDVAGGQQPAVRRESVTVITRWAAKPDAKPIHADTRFAVLLHIDAERVARNAIDHGRATKCRMHVIAQDADKRDR